MGSAPPDPEDLPSWRRRILDRVLAWTAVVAAVPCAAGVWLSVVGHVWPLVALDLGCWLILVAVALSPRLPYAIRSGTLVAVCAAVGFGVLLAVGPYGVGLLWLLAVPAIVSVLIGPRAFWVAQGGVLGGLLLVGALARDGVVWTAFDVPPAWWVMAWTSLLCGSLLVGLSASAMTEGLQRSLASARSEREALAAANRELQREIVARQSAEEARATLERQLILAQKMQAVGQLAGGVAHDLNNVLTVIRLEAALAQADVPEDSAPWHSLDGVLSAAASASALSDRLLTFARNRTGGRTPIDVDVAVRGLEPLLTRLVGERVALRLDLGADGMTIVSESVDLEQVLTNLVANARDALPHGGEVRISTRGVVAEAGLRVQIDVTDDGVGMDPGTLGRVFEPFFTTKPEGRGTGLGLATVYAIVASLDGTVEAHSSPGAGSTFRLLLPVAAEPIVVRTPDLPRMRLPTRPPRVLVVDDQAPVRRTVERVLQELGCLVWTAASVDEAVARLESADELPALVITDVVMPGRGGVDLAEEVTRRWPAVRLLAMSGLVTDGAVAARLQRLGVRILRKPFTAETLGRAVAEQLAPAVASA